MVSKASINIGYNFTSRLVELGATYSSIIITRDSSKARLMYHSTNEVWDEIYHHSEFSSSCHLINAVKTMLSNRYNTTLIWDMQQPTNEVSQHLNELRKSHNLYHGISLCQKDGNGITRIVTLTGRRGDIYFPQIVIENKMNIFEELQKSGAASYC